MAHLEAVQQLLAVQQLQAVQHLQAVQQLLAVLQLQHLFVSSAHPHRSSLLLRAQSGQAALDCLLEVCPVLQLPQPSLLLGVGYLLVGYLLRL